MLTAEVHQAAATISGDVGEQALEIGENPFEITVTAEDGTEKSYTVIVTRQAQAPLSSDADLKTFSVSPGTLTPAFNADVTEYTVEVPNTVASITLTAEVHHAAATISGDIGEQTLEIGENPFEITVTAEDGTEKSYTVIVTRQAQAPLSSDAGLKTLSVSPGTLTPAFNADVTEYTVEVPNTVASIMLTAEVHQAAATISGDVGEQALEIGENPFEITVTAEDGTEKSYTVIVTREVGTAITESAATSVNVYTDFATNKLFIETGDNTTPLVRFYSPFGGLLLQAQSKEIDLSTLASGVYILKINDKTIKIFKK
jgi:uncharacterized protein YrzB (UPF0473 family)